MTGPKIPGIFRQGRPPVRNPVLRCHIASELYAWALPTLQPLPQTRRAVLLAKMGEPVIGFAASMRGEPWPEEDEQ